MSTVQPIQPDVKDVLSIRFGTNTNFPAWTEPFIRAVNVLDKLAKEEVERLQAEDSDEACKAWDIPYLKEAESQLLAAVDLCDGKEALPLTWLTTLYMSMEDWPKARAAALKVVELDPFRSSSIIQLATCYEKEKDYIKACEWLDRGVSLTPFTERQKHHLNKLARLREQAADMKANVFRADPFDILPLEVIINIMQFGLEEDFHFVLKSSFINRKWRHTLVNNCPELWSIFKLPWNEIKERALNEKREAWIKRSGGRFNLIAVDDMPLTGVGKILKGYEKLLFTVPRLRLNMRDNKALFRFATKFREACWRLQHLYISGGDIRRDQRGMEEDTYLDRVLHCGLVYTSDSTLKTLEVRNVDFREYTSDSDDFFRSRLFDYDDEDRVYPTLERLTVSGCMFDLEGSMWDGIEGAHDVSAAGRYRTCPLHKMLLAAKNLQYLKVMCISSLTSYLPSIRQVISPERIEMSELKTIICPPPACWTLDMYAPNVEKLRFALPDGASRINYESRLPANRRPLIPLIKDSPVTEDQLANLTHLGFECCSADTIPRLGQWLSRMPNLVSLHIHGVSNYERVAHPDDPLFPGGRDDRVHVNILKALIDHPEWLPKLTDLQLIHCVIPDDRLVEFVKMRKVLNTVTPLTRLALQSSRRPSPETHTWLHREVMKPDGRSSGFSLTSRNLIDIEADQCDCENGSNVNN